MRVIDIDSILMRMRDETAFVLDCEECFHDKIGSACATIINGMPEKRTILLSGPSGSGKTTTANRVRSYLMNLGVNVIMLSMDNFFLPLDKRPPEAEDWESPLCVNFPRLIEAMRSLNDGKLTTIPIYDFKTGTSHESYELQGDREAVVIIEGIHALNPQMFDEVREEAVGMYVAPRTRIVTREDRIVRPEQIRVARRLVRDYKTRGYSIKDTIERSQSVDRGEVNYIMPYKPNAAIHIDTFHDYELCIISRYLKEISEFSTDEAIAAMEENGLSDLRKVLTELPPLRTTYVPKDSLIREFVGGSSYYED